MPAYVGRGELKLDTISVGLSADITLDLETEIWTREVWDTTPGGPESISIVPIRARLTAVLNDYTASNLAKLAHGAGTSPVSGMLATGAEYALVFDGINKADDCSVLTLTAPKFVITGSDTIPLVAEGFAAPRITGEILRTPGGSPEWFTLAVA
jgi:hypothetical protein